MRYVDKVLYVVFSTTPLKIGSMIRAVTGEKYNHVAISFTPDLKRLYSYGRYYKKAPFYGGFVRENAARYQNNGKIADVFVCAVPISKKECFKLKNKLKYMAENHEKYRYNILSAATAPLSKRIMISNCYTCIEFVVSVLSEIIPEISSDKFYSIEDLRCILKAYEFYRGPYPNLTANSFDEVYEKQMKILKALKLSVNTQLWLIKEYLKTKKLP